MRLAIGCFLLALVAFGGLRPHSLLAGRERRAADARLRHVEAVSHADRPRHLPTRRLRPGDDLGRRLVLRPRDDDQDRAQHRHGRPRSSSWASWSRSSSASGKAARLEQDLLAQSMKQAEGAKPDRRKEILALQQQASKAIGALKGSRLAKGGHAALYALPWYVIVGPPGAGKTTAIRHSGLDFPIEQAGSAFRRDRRDPKLRLAVHQRSDPAFDTAGRYSTETDDQQEWFAFLDLLKRNRPRKADQRAPRRAERDRLDRRVRRANRRYRQAPPRPGRRGHYAPPDARARLRLSDEDGHDRGLQ